MSGHLTYPSRERCAACGDGPCHDATNCNGTHTKNAVEWPMIMIDMGRVAEGIGAHFALMKSLKSLDHPRYQQAPTSPKPRFRKGR